MRQTSSSPTGLTEPLGRCWAIAAVVLLLATGTANSTDASDLPATTVLSMRVLYDADSCPVRAAVFLDATSDTISGFELLFVWDRPDPLQFELTRTPVASLAANGNPPMSADSVMAPKLLSDSGLVADWSLLEARGDNGHVARVIGLAELVDPNPGTLILPGDQGLLFELPLAVVDLPIAPVDGDSLTLQIQPHASRISTIGATLIPDVQMTPLRIALPVCQRRRSPH